ncbi:MAG: AAA family ATPase [Psychromonas sp.]|nr:AAA family ATPase [Psychromonas sp.]
MTDKSTIVEQAVAQGGAYEIIRKRLEEQGNQLDQLTQNLNQDRQDEFGTTEMKVLGRARIRTEHNCQATDLVTVGEHVLFGYNVFLGLQKQTQLSDVLALFKLEKIAEQYELTPVDINSSFLSDQRFITEFDELYAYYKDVTLAQLVLRDNKLLASFKIGEKITDIRVFRWQVNGNDIEYIDNRGERDLRLPDTHDFQWQQCTREDVVEGRNPHINVLDTLFIDSLRGDITIKIENNTDVGQGIYSEAVEESNQSINDAEFYYADLDPIILLKIKPYQEGNFRYLLFNKNNQHIQRIDAIGDSCQQLPENHGIIFPGGYYLTTGEYKTFDDSLEGLVFKRTMRSPNGEDVLFIFYQPDTNVVALYPYNLINKSLQNPILGHGFGFYDDGRLIVFYAEKEASRIHPVQIWQTAYYSDLFASQQVQSPSFFGKIGNTDLVRGVSELYSISKSIHQQEVSANHYNELSKHCSTIFDAYYWLESSELAEISALLHKVKETSESVIDEYEKVESIRQQSDQALAEAKSRQAEILRQIQPGSWHRPQEFVDGLNMISAQQGHLLTIREYRYIDVGLIDDLNQKLTETSDELNVETVNFLSSDDALQTYYRDLEQIITISDKAQSTAELTPQIEALSNISQGLDLISQIMASLKVSDATMQTQIVDAVSTLYSKINQQKAQLSHQQKSFGSHEAKAQFSARLKLINQSIHNALSLSTTPDKCDEQSARLLIQIEELESEFSDYDQFISDIITKRDEIFDSFESHKQSLIEARQRKAQSLEDAGKRILKSITKRINRFEKADEMNAFFAADSLINKVRDIITQLNELDSSVKAEDIDAKLKGIKAQALRSLRDKSDLFEDGGNVIKLGPRHKFSVNKQALDLSILPKDEQLYVRLSGTDYVQPLHNEPLAQLKPYWNIHLPSESDQLYRSEFLANAILQSTIQQRDNLSWQTVKSVMVDRDKLAKLVSEFASTRFKEGYEKGIHDFDATLILEKLLPAYESAGVFIHSAFARGLACVFWANTQNEKQQCLWLQACKNAAQMQKVFGQLSAKERVIDEIEANLTIFLAQQKLAMPAQIINRASEYLSEELASEQVSFSTSKYARRLCDEFKTHLSSHNIWQDYQQLLIELQGQMGKRWLLTESWLTAFIESQDKSDLAEFIGEAIGILNAEQRIDRDDREVDIQFTVTGLLGTHDRIEQQSLTLQLPDFLDRNNYFNQQILPNYLDYLTIRQQVMDQQKELLRLSEFKAKPLSSFVRNRLISDAYLPIIGDNLAKQMGTVGSSKRTDLMGLLLMISPPGYGKTTLMEYVADRLGLIFMKINCPVIGHSVTSVDPAGAEDSAARQELEKLNLALEMGSNVMLYLDDIQHTNSEFLQKFISLCDGTRKIEGVWQGKTKTYDMRGKKFCVVMAGNPYTETGETFQIPDMLANRADIYNLGDVLSGKEEVFNLSYIENALTSNAILAPLATREMQDVYKFVDMTKGKEVASTDFSHQYSGAEIKEIVAVLQKLQRIQAVVALVNRQYINSSAQDAKYRTEPPFKLQGSYRNMNKMAEKVSSIMTDSELTDLIDDHYQGESQLLTNGTEANLLKLAELRGQLDADQQQRWASIKADFKRNIAMGGDDTDNGQKIVGQLSDIVTAINSQRDSQMVAQEQNSNDDDFTEIKQLITRLGEVLNKDLSESLDDNQNRLVKVLTGTFDPLAQLITGKTDYDQGIYKSIEEINQKLQQLTKDA